MKIQSSYNNKVLFAKKKIIPPFHNIFIMAKLQMEETKQEEAIWEGREVEEGKGHTRLQRTEGRFVHPAQTSAETERDQTDIDTKKTSPWSPFRTLKQTPRA